MSLSWRLLVLATPLMAVWLASSLIALHGGAREAALVGGVLLFPVLPLAWELWATRRFHARAQARRQLGTPPKRRLTWVGRLVLRTLALNGLFLALLAGYFPKTAFTALATRGDWFIAGRQEPWALSLRGALFGAAAGLEWLHEWANPNPYKRDGEPVVAQVTPTEQRPPDPTSPWPERSSPDAGQLEAPPRGGAAPRWNLDRGRHPLAPGGQPAPGGGRDGPFG